MVIEFNSLLLIMAELLFLFLKGITGALAPFSYLVKNKKRFVTLVSKGRFRLLISMIDLGLG
jgi:hypothetical protein